MKITVCGINYAPEQTGIAPYNTGLCEFLGAAGHDVRMVSTFAYYPQWRKLDADRGRLFRTDKVGAIPVHRCWHFVPARPNAWKRMLHESTFVLTAFLRLLALPRPDVLVIVSPPLLLGAMAWLLCVCKRTSYLFHVQDMQPDAAVTLGMLRPGWLTRVLYGFERFAYRHARAVSGISPGMLQMFQRKGVPPEKVLLFPNWVSAPAGPPAPGAFRKRHAIDPQEFLALYSGNLGKKQGLDVVLDAAAQLARRTAEARMTTAAAPRVRLVIAGDGVEKPALEQRVAREGLSNVLLLPLQDPDRYSELLADANVCLVTQQPGSGALFFPSKLLTVLAHSRAVIGVVDPGGELERAIIEGQFGWTVRARDAGGLAELLIELARNPAACEARATRGRSWLSQFERDPVLRQFEMELVRRFGSRQNVD